MVVLAEALARHRSDVQHFLNLIEQLLGNDQLVPAQSLRVIRGGSGASGADLVTIAAR
jgi:hypothetical protein